MTPTVVTRKPSSPPSHGDGERPTLLPPYPHCSWSLESRGANRRAAVGGGCQPLCLMNIQQLGLS